MSLESILGHILDETASQKEKIIQQAQQERAVFLQQAKKEAQQIYQEGVNKETVLLGRHKQGRLVHARLESRKNLLAAKQALIDAVFMQLKSRLKKDKFKKEQIFQGKTREAVEDIDFYLNKVRLDYESQIAKILFQ